jgi:phenylalanine-4-hydroxylase
MARAPFRLPEPAVRASPFSSASATNRLARPNRPKLTVRFSVADKSGALSDALRFFWKHEVNMTRIESRPNKLKKDLVEFYVDFYGTRDDSNVNALLAELNAHCVSVRVEEPKKVAWFPKHAQELDRVANQV